MLFHLKYQKYIPVGSLDFIFVIFNDDKIIYVH